MGSKEAVNIKTPICPFSPTTKNPKTQIPFPIPYLILMTQHMDPCKLRQWGMVGAHGLQKGQRGPLTRMLTAQRSLLEKSVKTPE